MLYMRYYLSINDTSIITYLYPQPTVGHASLDSHSKYLKLKFEFSLPKAVTWIRPKSNTSKHQQRKCLSLEEELL